MHREVVMSALLKQTWKIFGKATLAVAGLAGSLVFAGAPSAKANGWDDRAAYTNWQLQKAIEHSGYYSPPANFWRHERSEAYWRREHVRREWRERAWREHESSERHRGFERHR